MSESNFKTSVIIGGDATGGIKAAEGTAAAVDKLNKTVDKGKTSDAEKIRSLEQFSLKSIAAEKGMSALSSTFSSAAERNGVFFASLFAGGVALSLLAEGTKKVFEATIEQEEAIASRDRALKGSIASIGLTKENLDALAESYGKVTTFSDDTVVAAEAVLLRFNTIGAKVFPDAIRASTDLAVGLGKDLPDAAQMLGKALSDPINGLTALQKAGIKLSDGQKESIRDFLMLGDAASAQGVILDQISKQYGGEATTKAETLGGSIKRLTNAYDDLFQMNEKLNGVKNPLDEITSVLKDEDVKEGLGTLVTGLGKILAYSIQMQKYNPLFFVPSQLSKAANYFKSDDSEPSQPAPGTSFLTGKQADLNAGYFASAAAATAAARAAKELADANVPLNDTQQALYDSLNPLKKLLEGYKKDQASIALMFADQKISDAERIAMLDTLRLKYDEQRKALDLNGKAQAAADKAQREMLARQQAAQREADSKSRGEDALRRLQVQALGGSTINDEYIDFIGRYKDALVKAGHDVGASADEISMYGHAFVENAIGIGDAGDELLQRISRQAEGIQELFNAGTFGSIDDPSAQATREKYLGIVTDRILGIDDAARQTQDGLALMESGFSSLGTTAGSALAGMTRGLNSYMSVLDKQATLVKTVSGQKRAYTAAESEQLRQYTAQQLGSYGDVAGAASEFFKQGSTGYKTLQAASQAFHIAEVALELESQVPKAINAILSQGEGDPYSAFARMAAMAAIVASLGVAVSGAFGSGSDSQSAAARQAAQGTGTVLGDANAKSESIANGIEELNKLETGVLSYSQRMLTQLTSINAGINGLGSLLIQANIATGGSTPFTGNGLGMSGLGGFISHTASGVYSAFDPLSAIGSQLGGLVGSILSKPLDMVGGLLSSIGTAVFGGKKSLSDTGINVRGTVGDFDARYYARIRTSGGAFSGPSYNSKYADLDAQTQDQIGKVISGLDKAVIDGISALGGDAERAKAILEKMDLDIGNISLKGLSGEDVQKQLQAVFSALGDRMAAAAGDALANINLTQFQHVGEGVLETLSRVAANFEFAKQTADKLGITLVPLTNEFAASADVASDLLKASVVASESTNGLVSGLGELADGFNGSVEDLVTYIKALYDTRTSLREVGINTESLTATLVNAAGGIDELQNSLSTYQDAFFSDSEKAAAKTATMTSAFEKLGLVLPSSYSQFRDLVDSIDTSTDAGQKLLGNVLSLASGFDGLQKSLDAANQAQQQLQDTLNDALGNSDLPEQKLNDLMSQFDSAYAMALSSSGADLQKQSGIINNLIGPLIDQIRDVYASGEDSVNLQDYVTSAVNRIISKLATEASGISAADYAPTADSSTPIVQTPAPQTTQAADTAAVAADSNSALHGILNQLMSLDGHGAAEVNVGQEGFTKLIALMTTQNKLLQALANNARLTALS